MITTVVLTRDPAGNRRWALGLRRAGFAVINAPMINTAPAALTPSLAEKLRRIANFDWLVLTSARAASSLRTLIKQANLPLALPPAVAVGPSTAAAAKRAGLTVGFVAGTPTSAALAAELSPIEGRNIALVQANLAPADLYNALQARGAHVTRLAVYTIAPRDQPKRRLDTKLQDPATATILASPSAALALAQLHPPALAIPAIAIGPTTAAAARRAGYTAVSRAAAPDLPSVISALKLL